MLRFAANLSWLWPELEPYDRFAAAAEAGFQSVEYLFPDELDLQRLEATLRAADLQLVLFDLPRGDPARGERGLLGIPGREAAFLDTLYAGLAMAERFGTRRVNALVGLPPPDVSRQAVEDTIARNLERAVPLCEAADVTLLLESLNSKDRPEVFLTSVDDAARYVQAASSPRVRLQLDQYNIERQGGDAQAALQRHSALVEHVQIADIPGRHQPGSGAQPIRAFLGDLAALGYQGYVGLEYAPLGTTEESLGWLADWGFTPG